MFITGLPLLPGEIGAVICISFPTPCILRKAATIPSETLPSRPSGLPTTKTFSPTLGESLAIVKGLTCETIPVRKWNAKI